MVVQRALGKVDKMVDKMVVRWAVLTVELLVGKWVVEKAGMMVVMLAV